MTAAKRKTAVTPRSVFVRLPVSDAHFQFDAEDIANAISNEGTYDYDLDSVTTGAASDGYSKMLIVECKVIGTVTTKSIFEKV